MRTAKKVTIGYYLGYISLGLAADVLGPTLPWLADQTGTQMSHIGILFPARAIGFLVSTLLILTAFYMFDSDRKCECINGGLYHSEHVPIGHHGSIREICCGEERLGVE